ncbi:unnamed protein product [Echinostoma caproni]|uniref:Uncharacterized protein n=1 Tax=Echinostoma caproni TaxID=27848 RepID=A0A3P8DU89_9TREM|nr:unnamed protein product [Echinostoma caproni]
MISLWSTREHAIRVKDAAIRNFMILSIRNWLENMRCVKFYSLLKSSTTPSPHALGNRTLR